MQEKMFIKSDFDPTKAAEKSPPLLITATATTSSIHKVRMPGKKMGFKGDPGVQMTVDMLSLSELY